MTTRTRPPLLLRGGITGRVYVVTDYTVRDDGSVLSKIKYDVTDQFLALANESLPDAVTGGSGAESPTPVSGSTPYESGSTP